MKQETSFRASSTSQESLLERRPEALAHWVVVRVAQRAHRLHDALLAASLTERQPRVLLALSDWWTTGPFGWQ